MLLTLLPLALIGPALAGETRALVGVTGPDSQAALERALAPLGASVRECWSRPSVCLLVLPGPETLPSVAALPGVRWAELDRVMPLVAPPTLGAPAPPPPFVDASGTADCPDLWELDTLRAETLWEQVDGLGAPIIAIEDSGFLNTHIELTDAIAFEYDFGDDDALAEVSRSSGVPAHGTFIAGLIAADPDNGRGRAGLAPRSQLYLQKIADSSGALYFSYAVDAMAALVEGQLEVGVLSYSLASSIRDTALEEAVAALQDADILVVAAAGNCGSSNCPEANNDLYPLYPAGLGGAALLSVAGTDRYDAFNPYSHYGATSVHLAAPGMDLCSLGVDGSDDVETASGTSYATPLVAAAAALLREAHPDLSAAEAAQALIVSAYPLAALDGKVLSGGRLDPVEAISAATLRLTLPEDLVVEGEASLELLLESPAAAGEGWILITLPEGLSATSLEGEPSWTLTAFTAGTALSLPDLGAVTADEDGLILKGDLPEHSTLTLTLTLRAEAVVDGTLTLRALGLGGQRSVMRWPYEGPALFSGGVPPTVSLPVDGVPRQDLDSADTGTPPDDEDKRCGGCSSPGQSLWSPLGLAALALLRRTQRGASPQATATTRGPR